MDSFGRIRRKARILLCNPLLFPRFFPLCSDIVLIVPRKRLKRAVFYQTPDGFWNSRCLQLMFSVEKFSEDYRPTECQHVFCVLFTPSGECVSVCQTSPFPRLT